jgi:hypothetical protein
MFSNTIRGRSSKGDAVEFDIVLVQPSAYVFFFLYLSPLNKNAPLRLGGKGRGRIAR